MLTHFKSICIPCTRTFAIVLLVLAMGSNARAQGVVDLAYVEFNEDDLSFLKKEQLLPVLGRVVYDKERIENCAVKVYRGNDLILDVLTDKTGRYRADLKLGYEYMFHFSKDGYLNKMFAVDAKNQLPKGVVSYPPFTVNIIMLPMNRFDGVDMDLLEFPFALVRYNKRLLMFDNDPKYTQNMSRAIAAAMLQSSRTKDK